MDGFYDVFDFWEKMLNGGSEYRPYSSNSLPPYDEYLDEEGNLCVDLALAGYEKENISIEGNEKGLLLVVDPPKETKSMKKRIHLGIKRSKMSIQILVPMSQYDVLKSKVTFEEGILSLVLPVKESQKFTRIQIT